MFLGSHEGYEGDGEEGSCGHEKGSHEGHEGDEEEEDDEGYEGDEEEEDTDTDRNEVFCNMLATGREAEEFLPQCARQALDAQAASTVCLLLQGGGDHMEEKNRE